MADNVNEPLYVVSAGLALQAIPVVFTTVNAGVMAAKVGVHTVSAEIEDRVAGFEVVELRLPPVQLHEMNSYPVEGVAVMVVEPPMVTGEVAADAVPFAEAPKVTVAEVGVTYEMMTAPSIPVLPAYPYV